MSSERLFKIGITGGIGAGKSSIAKILSGVTGYPLYVADVRAKELMNTDVNVRNLIAKHFGSQILLAGGQVDREGLAKIVFNDPEKLKLLNSIIHPATTEDFDKWCKHLLRNPDTPKGIIKEAAILFESGTNINMDFVIYVYAPKEIRIQRVMKRDNKSRESVFSRMENQWSDERKMALSDWIIRNYDPYMRPDRFVEFPDHLRISLHNRGIKYL
jgi:dephospho-CoA kinase